MAFIGWAFLLFLAQLHHLFHTSRADAFGTHSHHSAPSLCRPDQANALLKLKQSFFFYSTTTTTLASWQAGTDCCQWEGIGCSNSSGHVTSLDLNGIGMYSHGINPVLFNLTFLRLLDLSMNDFGSQVYGIPSVGFERLTLLTHLNLSNSGMTGQIPIAISKLSNLISLDLSNYYSITDRGSAIDFVPNMLSQYYFHNLVANLSNLRELKLDEVTITSRAENCFKALAKSVPHLQVLSLERCRLQGHIDQSLSKLHFLVVINLNNNYDITPGPFPEFVMNFRSLSVLQLSGINLEGWFPHITFQSENLSILDLSDNLNLSGHMPNFSNAKSLVTLRLHMTNFSYAKPSSFSNFKSLTELGLDGKIISLDLLSSLSVLASLHKLILSRLDLLHQQESLFSWIEGIKNLTSLELFECDFFVTIPSSIGNSKNLRYLVIYHSKLTTQTLSAVANLNELKSLSIFLCDILGQLPSAIGNMSNLERLDISDCQISGPIPHEIGALKKLMFLGLTYNDLSGRIPSSIVNLTQLTLLLLYGNHLSGEIPTFLFTLPALEVLALGGNQLSGPIKEFNVVSSHLKSIDLSMNELVGPIPQSFFALTSLIRLDISENNLMGSVDIASFWRLENLTFLFLSENKLSVTDGEVSNSSSTYLLELIHLELASCNMTKLPKFLMHLNKMAHLDLSNNHISGDIPQCIWNRWSNSLIHLNLSHNMFTGMQLTSYVVPFRNSLDTFDLSSNRLQGYIPMPSSSAEILDYSDNSFHSVIPNFTSYLSNTRYLKLSNNSISGNLPHSICDSPLEILDLSYNNFRGQVPPCLMENGILSILNLRENQFEGSLPSNISSGCSLQTIDLHSNKIDGQLPRALYNCTDLEVLDLGNNRIADSFPSWLGRLLNLRVLVLRSNQFQGSIGYLKDEQSEEHFSSLQIIDLASNNFSGNLHPQWFESLKSMEEYNNTGQILQMSSGLYHDTVTISYKGFYITFERILTTLTSIDLSDNALEGSVPASIGNLVSLHVLNLSHNTFSGEIAPHFGGMAALESLDLSSNMLSGEIPQELTNLTFLSILNLSNNQLEGRIPLSRQFATFQNSSFDGNLGLCGPPLSKQCGTADTPSEARPETSDNIDIVLFLFVGVGFGVGFAAAILVNLGSIKRWFHIAIARIRRT